MSAELKTLLEASNRAFEDFKTANDQRLKEIEKTGAATAETVAKVETANAAITELGTKIDALQKQIRDVETQAARVAPPAGSAEAAKKERLHARAFFARARKQEIKDVQVGDSDLEVYRNYRSAFFAFMVGGDREREKTEIRAALSVGTDTDGGLWVPPDTTGRTIEFIRESSPIRQIASVDTISVDALEGFNDLDEATSGWVSEKAARPETDTPEIGKWRINLAEQYAAPRATQRILDTSVVDIEGWLARKVADKIARTENTAFVLGDGINKPRGFMTYAAGTPAFGGWGVIQQVNTGGAGGFHATLPGDVFYSLIGSLKAIYRANATWVMARLTEAAVRKIKDGQGNYLWQPDFTAAGHGLLAGFPVVVAEDMAAIAGDSLSIAFGDFRQAYQIVDHTTGLRMLRDPYTAKPYVIFYTTKYTGGDVVNFDAIKIAKFAA